MDKSSIKALNEIQTYVWSFYMSVQKEPPYAGPTFRRSKYFEFTLLKEKSLRKFSLQAIFVAARNQGPGSRFYSLVASMKVKS